MVPNTRVTWASRAAKAILLIRILVGWVFLSEEFRNSFFRRGRAVWRFAKIGMLHLNSAWLMPIGAVAGLATHVVHRL